MRSKRDSVQVRSKTVPSPLDTVSVARNMLRLRFCLLCNNEMSDDICCNCEAPTVAKT